MRKSLVATVAFTAAAMVALTLMSVAPLSTPAAAKTIVSENRLEATCKRTAVQNAASCDSFSGGEHGTSEWAKRKPSRR